VSRAIGYLKLWTPGEWVVQQQQQQKGAWKQCPREDPEGHASPYPSFGLPSSVCSRYVSRVWSPGPGALTPPSYQSARRRFYHHLPQGFNEYQSTHFHDLITLPLGFHTTMPRSSIWAIFPLLLFNPPAFLSLASCCCCCSSSSSSSKTSVTSTNRGSSGL